MAAAGIVDPTKAGRYPVVLSDALLGKRSNEVYTGVRYNHRPEEAPDSAKLRQNVTFKDSYDLIYGEKGGIHKYRGNRTNDGSQYVLIFDPKREVFVLHKVDSTFNMNLTQTPENKNAESLKKQYPPLPNSGADVVTSKPKSGTTSQGPKTQKKPEPKAAAVRKQKNGSDDEESDDDDDGGLEIDFGDTAAPNRDFSPAFPPRRFSEFAAENEEEEDDADGEDEDEEMSEQEHFPLPSPIVHQPTTSEAPSVPNNKISFSFDDDSASEEDEESAPPPAPVEYQQEQDQDDNMEDELEAALEAELGAESESDVSEED